MSRLILKPTREKSLLRRHPWIFSGSIQSVEGSPESGATVEVLSSRGEFLGCAAYSPSSQIRARVWTFDPEEQVDADLLRRRVRTALVSRKAWGLERETDALRLIYAESDGIPGLIVDRYGEALVLQSLTAGAELWKETLADLVLEATGLRVIYERSDANVRGLEGLDSRVGWLRGALPATSFPVHENGLNFNVDLQTGHKTGFYLDQRHNRLRVRGLAAGRDVLDGFCYTGGFTLNALSGGAKSVLSVDSSAEALELCRENVLINGLPPSKHTVMEGDVFHLLRRFRDEGRTFDLIILDPPKFAPTAAQARKASRGYKDINLLAFKLLNPGGLLATFSCSGGVDADLFQKIVASAALDAGVEAQILEHFEQAIDHPVSLHFPEGMYLKGLLCLKL
jgi:23S rRNA (cytosine1962-C5)-methyltransferase